MEETTMNNEIMEETEMTVVEDQNQEDTYYPATTEDTDTDGGSGLGGLLKLAAIGAGGFILGKKFIWDKKLKPVIDKKRAAKKAEAEAAEEKRFEDWAVKRGLLVPTETPIEEPDNGEVQDVNPEEITEEKTEK